MPDRFTMTRSLGVFCAAVLLGAAITAPALADRQTLLRRATYDLTGQPPSEADLFLHGRTGAKPEAASAAP